MRTIGNAILWMVCWVGLCACSVLPQNLKLAPNVNTPESSRGMNATITVRAVDERVDGILGHTSAASFSDRAEIATDQDLASIIEGEIVRGLSKKGFRAMVCMPGETPSLKIILQTFKYDVIQGVWASRIQTRAVLKAVTTVAGTTHETAYRVEDEKKIAFSPTAEKNQVYVNQMLGDVLKVLLEDPQLMGFLLRV